FFSICLARATLQTAPSQSLPERLPVDCATSAAVACLHEGKFECQTGRGRGCAELRPLHLTFFPSGERAKWCADRHTPPLRGGSGVSPLKHHLLTTSHPFTTYTLESPAGFVGSLAFRR